MLPVLLFVQTGALPGGKGVYACLLYEARVVCASLICGQNAGREKGWGGAAGGGGEGCIERVFISPDFLEFLQHRLSQ